MKNVPDTDSAEYKAERKCMIDEQLVARGVKDPAVLRAFMKVPRHRFVPSSPGRAAYGDYPLPIGHRQTVSQPYIVAIMTENLRLSGTEKVLEVGTGSGYQTAILAEICRRVYTIERDERLMERAEKILSEEGYENIDFRHGDGTKGIADAAPFEGIIVTASAPHVPSALKQQLAEGGRMVIPVGSVFSQDLILLERKGNDFIQKNICECVFVPLVGEDAWREH
ncbi:MAG: protein-L-isoaspartate(D-aspartate) O-methyltransferase [Candidatus Omnitrophota bacterium]